MSVPENPDRARLGRSVPAAPGSREAEFAPLLARGSGPAATRPPWYLPFQVACWAVVIAVVAGCVWTVGVIAVEVLGLTDPPCRSGEVYVVDTGACADARDHRSHEGG
jgi:hypothetical protein